jgi:hypothetical protein
MVCNPDAKNCCTPTTCEAQGKNCGIMQDGCGSMLFCGGCVFPQVCGGTTPNICGCRLRDQVTACGNRTCGLAPDGCGGMVACGTCTGTQICNGLTQQCEDPSTVCETQNAECGFITDACGGAVDCGGCSGGEVCDGLTRRCGACRARSCEEAGAECGTISDGCGDTVTCNACGEGKVCDAISRRCLTCNPTTCVDEGKNCGIISNGCGGTLNCGSCTNPEVCGGAGTANVCGRFLDASCRDLGRNCGTITNACGKVVNCGTCEPGQVCLGNVCECSAQTCASLGLGGCGAQQTVPDGCGGSLTCGCSASQVCNSGACCSPLSCDDIPGQCGTALPNGCGGTLTCNCPGGGDCFAGSCCPDLLDCSDYPGQCGEFSNGCGAMLNCTCSGTDQCRDNVCTPKKSCTDYPGVCGIVPDNVGGWLTCGCTAGNSVCVGAAGELTGVCQNCAAATAASATAGTGECGIFNDTIPNANGKTYAESITCTCADTPTPQVCRGPVGGNNDRGLCTTCPEASLACGTLAENISGGSYSESTITCTNTCANPTPDCNGSGQCCDRQTCAEEHAGKCGTYSNGCGGNVTCTCGGGETCTSGGLCVTPRDCTAVRASLGASACGIFDNYVGGTVTCTCGAGNVCRGDGGGDQEGTCQPCSGVLGGAECGVISDNIPNPYSETATCSCSGVQANSVCIGPFAGNASLGICNTCTEAGRVCGSLTDNIGGYSESVTCTNTCMGATPDCNGSTNSCCKLKTCAADYAGQCGVFDNGCGGTVDCSTCPGVGQTCFSGSCVTPRDCTAVRASLGASACGVFDDTAGGTIQCKCGTGNVCRGDGGSDRDGVCQPCSGALVAGAECGVISDNIPSYTDTSVQCTCAAVQAGSVCRGPVSGNNNQGVCNTCGELAPPATCGSIADNISNYSETVTCTNTCGGATPDCNTGTNQCCDKLTCADYPGLCGSRSDGCGGTLNCTCSGGDQCVGGTTCTAPKDCSDYPGECGIFSNNVGGFITCTCSADRVCRGSGGTDVTGVCRTCTEVFNAESGLPKPQCGFVEDNIPNANGQNYAESEVCNCSLVAPNSVCKTQGGTTNPAYGLCRTCNEVGAECGTISDDVSAGNYTDPTVTCPGCTTGDERDCSPTQQCCDLKSCATDYPGQCGTFSNGCGGTITCNCGSNVCMPSGMCCEPKDCSDFVATEQCGQLDNGCGGTITCGCNPGTSGQVCRSNICRSCTELGVACGSIGDDNPNLSETFTCPNTCVNPQVCTTNTCCTPAVCNGTQHGNLPNGCGGTITCECPDGTIDLSNGTCCTPMDPCAGAPPGTPRVDNCGQTIICQGGG